MKTFITNRDNNKISVVVEEGGDETKLVFLMHGLGGNKEKPELRVMAEAFIEDGYIVVTWDAVHTFGESEGGLFEDATISNYYADLEDVIDWAGMQNWYIEPFVLCGHSLGGISTAVYAQRYPEKVKALAPIATVVNGELRMEIYTDVIDEWKSKGTWTRPRHGGGYRTLKWSHMEDGMKYDLTNEADKLTMPVLMVVGSNDTSTPPSHQRILYDLIPGDKEMHVIEGAEHGFYQQHEREELKQIIKRWLEKKVK